MKRKNNLRIARTLQWASGVLAIIVIYPFVRLVYPCWRRMKNALNPPKSDERHTADSSGSRYNPSSKSIPQGK